jgi:hypothetical protein
MKFAIRPVRAGDAEGVSALIRGLGLFRRLESQDPQVTTARISKHLGMCLADDSHSLFVATGPGNEPIAYAAVHWLAYLFLTGAKAISRSSLWRNRRASSAWGLRCSTPS